MTNVDLEADANEREANESDIAQIEKYVDEYNICKGEISKLEERLKELTSRVRTIEEEAIPTIMEQNGLSRVDTAYNIITINDVVRASLPAAGTISKAKGEDRELLLERLNSGLHWIRINGSADIIRNVLTVDIGKDGDFQAEQIAGFVKSIGFEAERSETVHPQTLSAFIREKLEQGANVPIETFGVYNGKKAVIKGK